MGGTVGSGGSRCVGDEGFDVAAQGADGGGEDVDEERSDCWYASAYL